MIRRPPKPPLFPSPPLFGSRMQRNIDALSSADRLYAWAFRIARNAIADHYRSPNRRDVTGEAATKGIDDLAVEMAVGEPPRSEEHTSELQSRQYLVCRLLLE